jgi:hypothetical protein
LDCSRSKTKPQSRKRKKVKQYYFIHARRPHSTMTDHHFSPAEPPSSSKCFAQCRTLFPAARERQGTNEPRCPCPCERR